VLRAGAAALVLASACGALTGCFASPPQIIVLDPNRGSIGVPADAPISVQFDRSVLRQTVVGRFSVSPSIPGCPDLTAAFSAGPEARCRISWLPGDSGFVLHHLHAVFQASRRYVFTLRGGFADPAGDVNGVDHFWDVTTGTAPDVRAITPADGSSAVPADLPLIVTFSTGMAAAPTSAAISLRPAVPGTRIVRNARDHSRFLVLPGQPLQPGVVYRLSVAASATDEHGQALLATAGSTFSAGPLSPVEHAVVLAGPRGGPATSVLTSPLVTGEDGDPLAAETMLSAPRCGNPTGCGAVSTGGALYTYADAALSPDARWIAAVEQDATVPAAEPAIVVVDAASGALRTLIPGASLPSWSQDGTTLAYAAGNSIGVYRVTTGAAALLPQGSPLRTPARWAAGGAELVALDTQAPGQPERVELADAVVAARYPAPRLGAGTGRPAFSPDGTQLAVTEDATPAPAVWLLNLGTSSGAPRKVGADLLSLGWTDSGTLLGVSGSGGPDPTLVQVSLAGGGQTTVTPEPPPESLQSVSLSSSGRLFAYLARGLSGAVQADLESVQGGSVIPITAFRPGGDEALAVRLT